MNDVRWFCEVCGDSEAYCYRATPESKTCETCDRYLSGPMAAEYRAYHQRERRVVDAEACDDWTDGGRRSDADGGL